MKAISKFRRWNNVDHLTFGNGGGRKSAEIFRFRFDSLFASAVETVAFAAVRITFAFAFAFAAV